MKKRLICYILSIIFILSLSGCNKEKPNITSSTNNKEEKPKVETLVINPFTGMVVDDEQSLLNRPVAVMVNNVKPSLPQRGIADADIVYELPVEGAITRLMAVFSDYKKLPDIGSIRSARHDYVELIAPYQPIYLHIGGSPKGKAAIKEYGVNDIDGLELAGNAFYQDKKRLQTYASEHTWFSNLKCLNNGIQKKKFKTTMDKPISPIFSFSKPQDDVMTNNEQAQSATKVSVKMSNACTATFDFDTQTGLYKKGQYNSPHIDTNTNAAVAVKNVLVMYTDVGLVPNSKNKEINLSKGTGYYISNGKRVEVTFSKQKVSDNLKVMDKSGEEIKINAGQTWICVSPDTYINDIVFE